MMERLTEKSKYGYRAKDGDYKFSTQKLGKLEDIEEELGMGLVELWEKVKGAKNNELSDAVGLLVVATLFASDNPKKFINDLAQNYKDAMIEEVKTCE